MEKTTITRQTSRQPPKDAWERRALQLTRKEALTAKPYADLLALVPTDWKENEDSVDEFLATLRQPEER